MEKGSWKLPVSEVSCTQEPPPPKASSVCTGAGSWEPRVYPEPGAVSLPPPWVSEPPGSQNCPWSCPTSTLYTQQNNGAGSHPKGPGLLR